jgi:hypothetical protein
MLEKVYDTLRGILFHEFPKNTKGQAVVYDRVITGFYVGDTGVKPNSISITLKGASSPLKDIALGLQEFEHSITLEINAGGDNIESTERITQEATRICLGILRKHRRLWVLENCPVCGKFALTPQHFTVDHSSLFLPYRTTVTTEFNNLWSETHPASSTAPTIPDSGLAAEAFIRLYNDVQSGIAVTGLSTTAATNIRRMQSDLVEPVRILYDVSCNDIKSSDDATNRQLFRNGTINITAKELVRQSQYGPDNVPTTAYSL